MPGFSPSLKSYKPLYTFLNKYGFKKGQTLPSRLESKNNKIWIYLNSLSIGFCTKDEESPYENESLKKLYSPDEISENENISYEAEVSLVKKFLKDNIKMILEYDENPSNALYNKIKNAWNSFNWSVPAKATASAKRKFKFKDGSIITASCAEEAKQKHKVMAAKIPEDIKKSFYFGPDIERFDTSATTHISSSDGSVEIAVLPMSFGDKNWKAVLLINTELNENKVTSAEGDDVLLDKPLIRKITNRLKETCSKYDFKNLETKRVILNKNHTCVVTIVSTYFDKDITEKEVKQKVNSISKDIK